MELREMYEPSLMRGRDFKINDKITIHMPSVGDIIDYGEQKYFQFADSVALMKRKMFWFKYPDVDYRWITYSKIDGGWVDYDDLKKARKERKKLKQAQTKGR